MADSEVYLVRHGQTEWNAAWRFQGRLDSPLTQQGRAEAATCGRILAPMAGSFDAVAVSPLGRALETSEIILSMATFPRPQVDARLCEVSLGSWDGLTHVDIDACWPGRMDGATSFDWYFRSPDGESYEAAYARARGWLREATGTVLAITHGLMSRILRGAYLGVSEADALRFPVAQGTVWHLAEGTITTL